MQKADMKKPLVRGATTNRSHLVFLKRNLILYKGVGSNDMLYE